MPGRGKVEPSLGPSALTVPVICPGQSVRGWRPGSSCALPQYPSPRCVSADQPALGLCFLPGEALKESWAGAPCRSRTGREAKSAPGPSTRTQAASVNSPWLICRRCGCLPSGRPGRAGGWESLRDAALELEGPSRAICSSSWPWRDDEVQGGRGRPKTPRAQLRLVSGELTSAGLPTLHTGLGRGPSSARRVWGEAGRCPRGALPPALATQLSEI